MSMSMYRTIGRKIIKRTKVFFLVLIAMGQIKSAGVLSGTRACPASGAITVTATSTPVSWAVIQAPTGNAGTIYVGQSGVTSTTGVALSAFGSVTLQTKGNSSASYDLGKNVYFACSNSGDSVVYLAGQ